MSAAKGRTHSGGRVETACLPASRLEQFVLALVPGGACFCCGSPFVSSSAHAAGGLVCPSCGAEVEPVGAIFTVLRRELSTAA